MRKEALPCIICGKILLREMDDYELQPSDGVHCTTSGNYGSTKVDFMNGESLHFNICDRCIVAAGDQGRVAVTLQALPVMLDTWMGEPINRFISTVWLVQGGARHRAVEHQAGTA